MCSLHCLRRSQQRFNTTWDNTVNLVNRAYFRGKTYMDYSGREQEYLRRKGSSDGDVAKVHANRIYIFSSTGLCLTVYGVPSWFGHAHTKACESAEADDIMYECESYRSIVYGNQLKALVG